MEWFCKSISVSARRPEIYLLRWYLHFNLAMLPLLNYQSYKITFTIMISLLSIPFPEWFFCSNSKIRNKKNRKKNYKIFKKNLCPDPVSGPVRSGQPDRESRSGPVRFRKSRSGRLLIWRLLKSFCNRTIYSSFRVSQVMVSLALTMLFLSLSSKLKLLFKVTPRSF